MEPVLLLNASYIPLGVISWMKAVSLLWQDKVEVLADQDRVVSSPSVSFHAPSVVRLQRLVRVPRRGVRLSRRNILARDDFTCQYCARRLPGKKLNLDHVIPRNQGGATCWDNLVTACIQDNLDKGGRTPEQAGMKLLRPPRQPNWSPAQEILAAVGQAPDTWLVYLGLKAA